MEYRSGGSAREIAVVADGESILMWTAEDGGRIRHSSDGGLTWQFQATPSDVSHTLLDIWFASPTEGWACGRNGTILRTVDGGQTWRHSFDTSTGPPQESPAPLVDDLLGQPANLWAIEWATSTAATQPAVTGFTVGIWTFLHTIVGYASTHASWSDVGLLNCSTGPDRIKNYEFYDIEILQDPQDSEHWIGFAVGQRHVPAPGEAEEGGVVFYTDNKVTGSQDGAVWWLVKEYLLTSPFDVKDIWEIEFAPGFTTLGAAVGYMCGGRGFADGHIYRVEAASFPPPDQQTICDSLWDFALELEETSPQILGSWPVGKASELYDLVVHDTDNAIVAGYAGELWRRDPAAVPPIWRLQPAHLSSQTTNLSCRIKTVYYGIGSATPISGPPAIAMVGAFGSVRGDPMQLPASCDPPNLWNSYEHLNAPMYSAAAPENNWRTYNGHFWDDSNGIICGQFQMIAITGDGGLTWRRVQGSQGSGMPSDVLEGIAFGAGSEFETGVACSNQGSGSGLSDPIIYSWDKGESWAAADLPKEFDPSHFEGQFELHDIDYRSGDVFICVGSKAGENGTPLIMVSEEGRRGSAWLLGPVPNSTQPLELRTVSFSDLDTGFVGGHSNGEPRLYRWDSSPTPTWVDVSPLPVTPPDGLDRRIRDLVCWGSGYTTTRAVAVGNSGAIYRYDNSVSRFVPLPLPAPASSLDVNLQSVAIGGATGDRLLIGVEPWRGATYLPLGATGAHPAYPARQDPTDFGILLDCNISNYPAVPMVTKRKALTNDGVLQIIATNAGAFLIGASTNPTVDSEIGSGPDTVYLRLEF